MLSSMAGLLSAFELPAGDRVDNLLDFLVRQRRSAACRVPGADQFKGDPRIHLATMQMGGEPGRAVVALAFGAATRRQLPPLGGRRSTLAVGDGIDDLGDQPRRCVRNLVSGVHTPCVALTAGVYAGRHQHVAIVATT